MLNERKKEVAKLKRIEKYWKDIDLNREKQRVRWALTHPPKPKKTEEEKDAIRKERLKRNRAISLNYYYRNKEKICALYREKWAIDHPPKEKILLTPEEKIVKQKEKAKLYYLKNKEIIKEKQKKYCGKYKEKAKLYYLKNKEKYSDYRKIYYLKNKEYLSELKRQNRDPEKDYIRHKKWREGEGREAYKAGKKSYIINNREKVNEYQRKCYLKNWFGDLDVPQELIEAKNLQLTIVRDVKNEKRI